MKDLIDISKGFQTSVNIAYDLNDDDKVRNFIPTMSSIDVIEEVLLSITPSANQRARILIGAYGRGKSHIILVLMSLLFKKDNHAIFDTLLLKMKETNPSLHDFACDYLKSNQKILPIVVRGSSASLTQSFLSALQQTLSEEGLSDLMPETHFKAAIRQIENWRDAYPSTYKKFIKELSKPVHDFIIALEEYDVNIYEEFISLYPALTSGSIFNPFLGFDVPELYENIAVKLKDKGYTGIYVIYDEFSKYLESSMTTATNSDIKLLQDFAEKCNRSGNTQIHLMLISHKDIANYIDSNLPKDKVDGWRGVSGRFKHINLHNNYSQMYEIISAVIHKQNPLWDEFCNLNQERFNDLGKRFTQNGLLTQGDNLKNAIYGCYPLHPISTFILPRLSEKVAQNERTLFTFLSSDDKYALPTFINNNNAIFTLLTPDYIYDYFEPLFRKEPYTSEVHKIYKLATNILRKVENKSLNSKIIKTIALIYIVEQFEKLPPVMDIIADAFRDSVNNPKDIDLALKELIDSDCVVYLKRSNNYLKIKESSGIDIHEEITKYKNKHLTNVNLSTILNDSDFESYIYPTAYNDDNSIIRYFDFTFIESKKFFSITDWGKAISDSKADGVIYAIVPENRSDIAKIKRALLSKNITHPRIIFVLPRQYTNITNDALDYCAVKYLKEQAVAAEDSLLIDEYNIYVDDLADVVNNYISTFARPENSNALYFHAGHQHIFRRKAQLTGLLTEICTTIFTRTPIINNESINKNELPTVAINSRTKVLTGLLANELAPNIGLTGSGQDVSIMRSTLIQTGILQDIDNSPFILLNPRHNNMEDMLAEINNFFTRTAAKKSGVSFEILYNILTKHENGFGLKLGVIPIYIALILHLHKKNLVILHRCSEVKITPELLNSINENPSNYSVILEDWNEAKAKYMGQLEEIFADFIAEREKSYNSFTYIVFAMNRWYLSLPKYAKEMTRKFKAEDKSEKIDISKNKFTNSLKQTDINPREFLFEKVFEIFGMKEFSINIIPIIRETKHDYDSAVNLLIYELSNTIKIIFSNGKPDGSLSSIIKDWHESLSEKSKQYLYSGNENKILDIISNITNDETLFVQRLAKAVTYLRIDDWNDDIIDIFLNDLKSFKKTIETFNNSEVVKKNNSASYEIIFTGANGERIPKRFDKAEYSNRAKLLLTEMTSQLDEYGQSITEQEKRQILLELLETLC